MVPISPMEHPTKHHRVLYDARRQVSLHIQSIWIFLNILLMIKPCGSNNFAVYLK